MNRLAVMLCACVLANAQERIVGVNFYSGEKESQLGARLAAQVLRQSTIVESATTSESVERVGSKLAAVLPDKIAKYRFSVVEQNLGGSTHEPLALPGGYVFVPANLLLAARTESELAGMLAHAMGHVAARHGTRQATRAQILDLQPGPGALLSSPGAADVSMLPRGLLTLQRSFELEADRLAVGMTSGAGYDPEALVRYIARLQPDTTPGGSSALPPRNERVAAIRTAIQQMSKPPI